MADKGTLSVALAVENPEVELLLCCARTSLDPEKAGRLRALLREEIDWECLLRMADEHGMEPLLYRHLDATFPEAVPVAVLEQLRNRFHGNSMRNLFLTRELLNLLKELEARGVPAVPYKGPALAALAYGNLALRVFSDLDILIRRQDVTKAGELLVSLGYRPEYQPTRSQEATFLRTQCECPFTREDDGTMLDLHWEIVERHFSFALDPERLWERLERTSLGGVTVLTLSPEDLLLILCVHGSKHLWQRLSWICDIAELIRIHERLDWERLMEQARALGGVRMLFLGLSLANGLLGAALPEKVSQTVHADPAVRELTGRLRERLFQETGGAHEVLEESPFHPLHLKMRERWRDKIRYFVRTATTHTARDWQALPLPAFLSPIYYALRPIRLSRKYGRTLLRRVLR